MAGGVSIGMIGGNPLMKVKKVIGEFLPLTKSLDGGGGLGGLMDAVINGGGLQAIMKNPMGALAGQLQGQIGQATGSLTGAFGDQASGLVSALSGSSGLSGALGGVLSSGSSLLSGAGIMKMMGHANIEDMAGSALPSSLRIERVLAPLTSGDLIAGVSSSVSGIVSNVMAGTLPVESAIPLVEAHTASLKAITNRSDHALDTLSNMATDIAAVSTIAAAFVSAPPQISAVLETAMSAQTAAIMRASVATHLDEPTE